ncbi:MAG: SprT family zinc-dependent metalloprotease [Bacteroidales bacterium]
MEKQFTYRIIYSRRRTISIGISPGKGVVVRAPFRASRSSIENFVRLKSGWIMKHLGEQESRISLHVKEFREGDQFLLHGKNYIIRIIPGKNRGVSVENDVISIACRDASDPAEPVKIIENWLQWYSKEYLTARTFHLAEINSIHSLNPSHVKVRKMKSRWGSCSTKGSISLNQHLVRLDTRLSDYVILHELCHLRHHNHGALYYKLLQTVCPYWKDARAAMRTYTGRQD